MMFLTQVAKATGGSLVGLDAKIREVVTDTRSDCSGGLFIALKGENFDAHEFIKQAEAAGAVALMVEKPVDTSLPSVQVKNTQDALGRLAKWWREQFDIPLMAITGSAGKTTVKEMLACIFARLGEGVVTKGNLNNEIGVPITLLRLRDHHKYAVIEMGMNHAGEIHRLSKMARPTVAMINNAAAAHLEGLGSVSAVAQAKGEIFHGLQDEGVAVINLDDDYSDLWEQDTASYKQVTFGLSNDADISAKYEAVNGIQKVEVNGLGEPCRFDLHAMGEHSVCNALAAATVAKVISVSADDVARGLATFRPVQGRLEIEEIGESILIDDTYNANPASMKAAIDVLATYLNSILIVGDMAELGKSAEQEHRSLGAYAQFKGIKQVYACGVYAKRVVDAFAGQGTAYSDQKTLLSELPSLLERQTLPIAVLVKGSRSARMERVIKLARDFFAGSSRAEVSDAV